MWKMNLYVLLSEQFGAASDRKATVIAMQNGLSADVVIHLKASRPWERLPQGYGFWPLEHFNFALCLDSSVREP